MLPPSPAISNNAESSSIHSFFNVASLAIPLLPSRYQSDFQQVGLIARGAFGAVFKARHHIDGREYAIKKVRLTGAKKRLNEKYNKMFREVKAMSGLDNENVVRYYASWIEEEASYHTNPTRGISSEGRKVESAISNPFFEEGKSFGDQEFSEYSEESSEGSSDSAKDERATFSSSSFPFVLAQEDESDLESNTSPLEEEEETSYSGSNARSEEAAFSFLSLPTLSMPRTQSHPSSLPSSSNTGSIQNRNHLYLFIQMQLCTTTLYQYLALRNRHLTNTFPPNLDLVSVVDGEANRQLIGQICKGVSCVHEAGLVHRDLKPGNVFLEWLGSPCSANIDGLVKRTAENQDLDVGKWRVKIGDFGLATNTLSPSDTPTVEAVGTVTYAAPEQIAPTTRPQAPADIYALGIMIFELYHPFRTAMERAVLIRDLRELRQLPDCMLRRWPRESAMILWMTVEDPNSRASITEVTEVWEPLEMEIVQLRRRLNILEERIKKHICPNCGHPGESDGG